MLDQLLTFRLYLAVKLHFSSETYDVIDSNGRMKHITYENLTKNKARYYLVDRLSKQFDDPKELIQFCVAQHAYGDGNSIYDKMLAQENYDKWCTRKISTTRNAIDDFHDISLSDVMNSNGTKILYSVAGNHIKIESAVILSNHLSYLRRPYQIFDDIAFRIQKLKKFVKYDKERFCNEIISEHKEMAL